MKKAAFLGLPEKLSLAYPPKLRSRLAENVNLAERELTPTTWQSAPDILRDCQILLGTWQMPYMDAKFLDSCPELESVFYAAGSIKGFASPEAFERGIIFCSAWAANAIPVAEYTTSTILLSLKQFWRYSLRVGKTGSWSQDIATAGAFGSTVGLLSLGAVGLRTAEMLLQSDVKIIAYDPYFSAETAALMGIELTSLEDVFRRSDVISVHTPWLPSTERMINRDLIGQMKRGATIINSSRGAVIDEPGLCAVLAERPDLTAILDVTYPEPPAKDSCLLYLENVILTPHIAGSVDGEVARMGHWMTAELESYLHGRKLRHQVKLDMLERMA